MICISVMMFLTYGILLSGNRSVIGNVDHSNYPFHTTGSIARGDPALVKRPCPWITVCRPFANLQVSVESSITLHILQKF